MTIIPPDLARDYFVMTREDRASRTWTWEIHRRSKLLGVRVRDAGFPSESAAKLAGEESLRHLLQEIARSEGR